MGWDEIPAKEWPESLQRERHESPKWLFFMVTEEKTVYLIVQIGYPL